MSRKLKVSFESPQSGWMSFSLSSGQESFIAVASCKPYDSLRDLILALTSLLNGEQAATVKWNSEPDEYDFRFKSRGEDVALSILHYTDHRRMKKTSHVVFSLRISKLDFCSPLWRALRDLQMRLVTDEFERNWRREFPKTEMQQLTRRLRQYKRELRMKASGTTA